MGDKPKDTIPCEEKRLQELNLFDPWTNIDRNVTGEHLSEFFYSQSLSSPSVVLFNSIEGMSIATSMNLSTTNIANEVVVNHKNSSSDEKITLLLRKLCFTGKDIQNIEKSTQGQSDSNAWKQHRKGRLTSSKYHELYSKINSISKVRSSTHPKTTPFVYSIIFPDDKLKNLEPVKWGRDNKGNVLKAFYAKEGVNTSNLN